MLTKLRRVKRNKVTRYKNPYIQDIKRKAIHALMWKMGFYDEQKDFKPVPANFKYPFPELKLEDKEPKAVWINHSTFLVTVDNVNILTDPIWSQRCSPLSFFGPVRRHHPAVAFHELPHIDYVLISHNHYDHLDEWTVRALNCKFPGIVWVVPTGVKEWFDKRGFKNVKEIGWWEDVALTSEKHPDVHFVVTGVPSQHFSGRGIFDQNKTLWQGYVVEAFRKKKDHKRFYFVGDTGYNDHDFNAIGAHWPHMDLSLIPIGTYVPRRFMSPVHIEPAHAVKIHMSVKSKLTVGMHWMTFNLSDEAFHQPPYDLLLALNEEGVDPKTFLPLEPGHVINW